MVTHSEVRIVSADEYLTALGDNLAVANSCIYDSLISARADGLYLVYGVSYLEKTAAALKEISQKVRAQTKAENRQIQRVNYFAKLINLG